jgi:uncharacterized membrane protein YebE (DUF533 family)
MAFGNIIGGLLQQGLAKQSHQRLRTGAEQADRSGGIEGVLGSLLGGGAGGSLGGTQGGQSGGFGDMARDFLNRPQAGGMSGAKIGGLGALVGGLLGGGLGGAAKGGAMAVLGTLALKALREHQAGAAGTGTGSTGTGAAMAAGAGTSTGGGTGAGSAAHAEPTREEIQALTDPRTERLVLRAMIGAAQVDGHVSEAELDRIFGQMGDSEVTEDERRAVREEVARPVDVEALGREVSRPEVATEIYLAALLSVDIDTEAERDYFRRLASALRLESGVIERLHRMTDAPRP